MRITRGNMADLREALGTLIETAEIVKDAAEEWESYQDEPKTDDTRDTIREARETFVEHFDQLQDQLRAALAATEAK